MKNNPRITDKERNLLKGAVRRVFARSELRRRVLDRAEILHSDPDRPRVSKWIRCAVCLKPCPKYLAQADHIDPVVPLDTDFKSMGMDLMVDRTWCEEHNLQPVCRPCHQEKSKAEMKQRRKNKKEKKLHER